ncbi:MAG: hypothetical protein RL076_2818 [Chloroflexota bacterium]
MSNRKKQPARLKPEQTDKIPPPLPGKVKLPKKGPNIGVIAGIVVGIGLVVALIVTRITGNDLPDGTISYRDLGQSLHLQTIDDAIPTPYNSDPATSGYHVGSMLAPWGIQAEPLQDKVSVHNLEHGGIIVHYRPDLNPDDLARLTTLARDLQRQNSCLIVVPRDGLKHPVVLTAWTYMLPLDAIDTDKITAFFTARVGKGPEPFCKG